MKNKTHYSPIDYRLQDRDSIADSLRGFALIFLVTGHVILSLKQSGWRLPGDEFLVRFIYSFHMPFFFMIAGYVHGIKANFSGCSNFSQYLKKYAVDLYLPCLYFSLAWGLPKYFLTSVSSNTENFRIITIHDLLCIPLKGLDSYWFLCTLFLIKIIHVFLESKLGEKYFNTVLWLAVFVAAKFLGWTFLDFTARFSYGLYFHAGVIIRRRQLITQHKSPNWIYGAILLLSGIILFLIQDIAGKSSAFTTVYIPISISLAFLIIFYAFKISNKFLSLYGMYSMVIYAVHLYVITLMRFVFRFSGLSGTASIALLYAVCLIVSVVSPLIVVWLYKNIKSLRWMEYIFYPGKLLNKRSA